MSTNDAAALLCTVDSAQSTTRRKLRARMPEFSALVAAGSFAVAIGHRGDASEVLQAVGGGLLLSLFAWIDGRRRHRVGGRIDAAGWAAIAVVFVAGATCNLVLASAVRDNATAACLCLGLVVLAVADRNAVLALPVALLVVTLFLNHGTVESVVSGIAGVACAVIVRHSIPRRRTTESRA